MPVLVMHSATDNVIPFRLGEELFSRIEGPKQLHEMKTGMHSALYWSDPEGFIGAIRSFTDEHCRGSVRG